MFTSLLCVQLILFNIFISCIFLISLPNTCIKNYFHQNSIYFDHIARLCQPHHQCSHVLNFLHSNFIFQFPEFWHHQLNAGKYHFPIDFSKPFIRRRIFHKILKGLSLELLVSKSFSTLHLSDECTRPYIRQASFDRPLGRYTQHFLRLKVCLPILE